MNDASFLYSGEGVLLVASVVLFFGILASKAGFRMGLPSLLLFLFVGMLFGKEGVGIEFNDPETMQFIGMMALSIILFSGGMETHYSDIKPIVKPGLSLATVGVLITVIITGLFVYYLSI
ncbi:MAG: cation:proton antiporter, partial [Bacteroidales bacterium]